MRPPDARSSLADWLSWQERLHPKTIALGLDRVRAVAQRLNLPAAGVRTVTVAGTNGKGSSTTLLGEIYRAAGYRVGVYTSPHLLRYNERVVLNGCEAGDADFCRAFAAVEQARADLALTYFEFGTLAALWLFREAGVQVQVLEVGLGGRLDAVNIVDADAALVTNIGLDHQDWLGPDRESIGREKAGVFRTGRPAVCADPQPPASLMAWPSLQTIHRDYDYQAVADAWNWRGVRSHYKKLPPPALAGVHQVRNAAGVLAVIESLQTVLPVSENAVRSGLIRLNLPGRFQRRGNAVFDVAHNAEAAEVLARQLQHEGLRDVLLVLGMLSDKPVEAFCAALAPCVERALLCTLPGLRGLSSAQLAGRSGGRFRSFEQVDSPAAAMQRARGLARPGQTILVCGSFLTVAAVLHNDANG